MNKIGANDPCYCGSGKKFKRCHRNAKPRNTEITYDFRKPVTINSVNLNTISGKASFSFDGQDVPYEAVELSTSYDRPNKQKILNITPLSSNKITINNDEALEPFDFLLAIDTNTIVLNKNKISVSCLVGGKIEKVSSQQITTFIERKTLELKAYDTQILTMWNIKEKEENVGWVTFLDAIMRSDIYREDLNFAVIVDSDLGNIDKYNQRQLPLFGDFFLPPNMTMVYASRDSGAEFSSNKLIRLADSESTEVLNAAKKMIALGNEDEFLGSLPVENKPYSHSTFQIKKYLNNPKQT